jgi:hypothetical protein
VPDLGAQLGLADQVHLVDQVPDDAEGQLAGERRGQAAGEGGAGHLDQPLELPGAHHRGRGLGLHADDLDGGLDGLGRERDPGDQVAAAHRDDDGLGGGQVLEDLPADGGRARHQLRVLAVLDVDHALGQRRGLGGL